MDLRDWIYPQELIAWLEQAIDELDDKRGDTSRNWQGGHASFRSSLFCLLGFAYSTGVFCSQEIVRNCYSDSWFRSCSGNTIPFRNELVAFRRKHRASLEEILARVFGRALAVVDQMSASSELTRATIEEAKQRLDFARHLDSCDE